MFENAQSFINYIFAHDWALYIALFIICFVVVLIVSAIKYIVITVRKATYEKKFEYAYAIPAFLATFGICFGFMFAHNESMSIAIIVVKALSTAFMTQGVYLFLCQSPRKIATKVVDWAKNLYNAYKQGKLTTKKLVEETEKLLDTTEKTETKVDVFYKLINKD